MPRAKGQSSLSKNQMQLALALSSSLEESKNLELSNLTEALPASTIEDGTVPQNIKQLQKEFLERLKVPKVGPSKKSKKPPKPVPTLLVRSSEERLRIITEKVALVLIKDDCYSSAAKDWESLNLLEDDGQKSALWSLSWTLSSDKTLYYLDCLATFISPSEAKTGSKLNNTIQVPRKLTRPSEALHIDESSQSPSYKEHEMSSYNKTEADFMDPDFVAQTELQNDWHGMLNNSKFSDITIVVKERSHVCAHKLVLFVRCPAVIEDLDDNNMLYWTTVAHSQALAFLEYLYSGKLTGIHALGENVGGVVLLARKYKITELLKFLLIYDFGVVVSDSANCDIPPCSPIAKTLIKSRAISPDLFAEPREILISNDKPTIDVNNTAKSEPQISIEISSDEEGEDLVKEFFGTYNPTFSNTLTDVLKEPVGIGIKASNSQQEVMDSDEDMFSSPEVSVHSFKHGHSSPETSDSKNHPPLDSNILHIESSSDEDTCYSLQVSRPISAVVQPSVSPKVTRKSLFQKSTEKYLDRNESNSHELSFVDSAEEDNSCIFSTPCTKRKQSYTDEITEHSSFYKRRRALNESVSLSSSPELASASCSHHTQTKHLDDSFNSVMTRNLERTFETKNVNSPNKVLDLNESDYTFSLPKNQRISSLSTDDSEKERKLLDDSFNFDINDSVLLRQAGDMQTPKSKNQRLDQLRTPLDNVKLTSPVTPMPDYGAMTNEQFEMELQRFGLKRGLSRSKGIKMLTHIYGKLHPLVEIVSVDGKELLIPLGERTPGNERSPDDEPLSQRSAGSSDDACIMMEETICDEEEDLTQGVSSRDLKTAVRLWITSQPEIHEMILSYEPIWLDSFHTELKSQFDKRIKVNQLMDVLDEEGITFRLVQGQQNRRKQRNSPKKKRDSPKKKKASPKKKLPVPD